MSLTREETIVAARCARDYPIGQGYAYFAYRKTGDAGRAAAALARHPHILEHG